MRTPSQLPGFRQCVVIVAVCFWALYCITLAAAEPDVKPAAVGFARDIQPIFAQHCIECHGPKRQEGGLRLNSKASAFVGGDSGEKAIIPTDAKASRLLKVINGTDAELKMPPEGEGEALDAKQIELISRWISEGAPWPAEVDDVARPSHWAWQQPLKTSLARIKLADWPRHPIDHFVLATLEEGGLAPAPEADRYLLARRVHLDLLGLPPTREQIEAFIGDPAPGAYERMVDRALADPAYGERWARGWLDLARYADSKGYGSDPLRTIWRYRDWVISAFNRNLPFDQFTIEQLAGDLLPQPTPDQILATAFHRNTMANDEGGTDDEEFRVAAVKDRIETTMQVWMGLTMGCAKCHSHKFDPITQREYYQGYAFFDQTEDADRGDEEPKVRTPTELQQQQMADRRAGIVELEKQIATPPTNLETELVAWEQSQRVENQAWIVLKPLEVPAEAGTTLQVLPDHSVLASGTSPDQETYVATLATELKGITAIRVEALPHESLPQQGPGRANGNFVLNEVRLSVTPHASPASNGRYVRIELPGPKQILSLAEVQVFSGSENLAPQGKASQSSTSLSAAATRAIDNQTAGEFQQGSVTHTDDEKDPWWEVDLGRSVAVDRIAVWNRTDAGVEARLKDFQVSVLDENRKLLWQRQVKEPPKPSMQIDLAGPTQWTLVDATADFSQEGWPAEKAIDGDTSAASGWAVSPRFGEPHQLVVHAKPPISLDGPTTLSFTLAQSHGGQHTLGRFRISASTDQSPPNALPEAISEILASAPDQRTSEQRNELTKYYWAHSPATKKLRDHVAQLDGQVKELEKQIPPTPIMRELAADKRRVTRTMIKGNFRVPSDIVEPAVPAAFHPLPPGASPNRLGLARWLMADANPLTARVAVNRFWAQLFGAGLVATEEDFGTQGLPPTHPEVLDWLAVEFRDNGWDIKDLLRQIVCSATYRQSSSPAADVLQKDPQNKLLSRGPRFRLEAEMVRDQALAISGLLSHKQGGPSVYPPQPPGLWRAAFNGERTWATSSGDDRYRRGLYTYWRRTVPYPSMAAFDAPSREICTLRRISTNTPLQAFVTLNDPVYVEAAQALARRIVTEGGPTVETRCEFSLQLALCRPPQQEQIEQLLALYRDELNHYQQDKEAATQIATEPLGPVPTDCDVSELAAWTVVSNVILNLDGVLTKR